MKRLLPFPAISMLFRCRKIAIARPHEGDALYRPETHAAFRRIVNLGLMEAVFSAQTGDDTYILGLLPGLAEE